MIFIQVLYLYCPYTKQCSGFATSVYLRFCIFSVHETNVKIIRKLPSVLREEVLLTRYKENTVDCSTFHACNLSQGHKELYIMELPLQLAFLVRRSVATPRMSPRIQQDMITLITEVANLSCSYLVDVVFR